MVCYPEVQKEAQKELDNVLNGRLPELDDISSLPYLSALIKEVYRYVETCVYFRNSFRYVKSLLRWEPLGPLGKTFPSLMITSCHPYLVKAFRISQPTTIFTTTIISPPTLSWSPINGDNYLLLFQFRIFLVSQTPLYRAMLNDERDYPEPYIFKPERFLKDGKLNRSVRDPMKIVFGFGRR